jgi:UDP-N-acetylmuramoyl-tripeptide--D-alanyl-D-alanine ligase
MISLSVNEIADAVDGKIKGDGLVQVTGSVETDSRLVASGSLFVAKPGEETDGHLFVDSAANKGAVAAIVERIIDGISIPQIQVKDSVLALGKLAGYVLAKIRETSNLKVVGITGSNGKTTTKNMLREILSTSGETIAPIESYNNI